MTTRAMGPLAAIGWLKNGINLGRHNPKAIFGGAALLLLTAFAVGIAAMLLQLLLQSVFAPGVWSAMALTMLAMLPVLLAVAVLMAGYLRLIHAVESGRSAGASDVFHAFGDGAVAWRMIGFVVVTTLLQYAVLIGLLSVLAGDVIGWYAQMMQVAATGGAPVMSGLPDGIGIAYAVMLVVGLVFYAAQAIGLGQIALRGRGMFGAVADGLVGVFKNVLPLLVLLVASLLLCVVAIALVFVFALLFAVVSKVALWLAVVLAIPLYLAAMLAAYVVVFGVMYHLWRDVCDGGDEIGAQVEAVTA